MSDYFTSVYPAKGDIKAAVDESIMVKGHVSTACSEILYNFVSPFTATIVERLENAGIGIVGRTKMDEFGIDKVENIESESLSGAVGAVKSGDCTIALCNDFSGKVRRQAAENGLFYIHPTYGTVSRFGLIASVSSMDQIGVLCKNLHEGFKTLSIIAGHDSNDGTSYPEKSYIYAADNENIKSVFAKNTMADAAEKVRAFAEEFKAAEIELPYFDVMQDVQYILSCAEISNNINRYDGIKFGYRAAEFKGVNDLYLKSRTEGFGEETKLSSIMGSMVLSENYYEPYYMKSMQIRRLIKEAANKIFKEYDVMLLPASYGENYDIYKQSALYAFATLAGLPSVSFSINGCALQAVAQAKNENALYSFVSGLEGVL